MTQAQAVKEIIRKLGGVATLKEIYKHIHEIKDCTWGTKTPEATIRRIVQTDPDIIKMKAGHYCLAEYRDKLVSEQLEHSSKITTINIYGSVGQVIAHADIKKMKENVK